MGFYTFSCQDCGEFTEWQHSTSGQKNYSFCPECEEEALRVFKPAQVFKMESSLKKRIERGMEPKVVKKDEMPKKSVSRKSFPNRPWQVGH